MELLKPFPKILKILLILTFFTLSASTLTAQPTVSFLGNKVTSEGNAGYTNLIFTVNLSNASTSVVSVDFATSDGSAIAGSDYVALSGTIVFNPGQTSKTITVQVIGDTNVEPHENFYVTLSNPVNASLGTIFKVTGSIFNDDSAPLPSLYISGALISEGNSGYTNADFGVTLSTASTSTVTVNFSTSNGNAIAGSDYIASSGTITFPPGTTTKTITVQVVGDLTNETNENFFVTLSSPTNATISIAQGQGTIINDDDLPTLSINDVSIIEGNSGTALLNFTISLSSPSTLSTSVNYATINNTAIGNATPGLDDYTMKNDVVVLNPGVTSLIVDVPINGDIDIEGDEEFYVDLSNPVNATILKGRGVGTILTDDYPFLSINDVSITEGNSGTSAMTFNVSLSQPSPLIVTVNFTTADSTATSGSDYVSTSGSLTFLPGEVSKNISINIYGDTTEEPDEVFSVALTSPTNAKLGDKMGIGTILNDDQPQAFTLIVSRTGSGSGIVTSTPTGIDCGSTCSYTFSSGTVVTLTATPDAGSSFAGWSGAATGTGVATITMDANKAVSAAFTINTTTISNFIWKDINGDGIQNGSEPGFANIQVNLLDSANATLATTTSDASGFYAFNSVVSGTYKIKVTPPSDWGFTLKEQGGNPVIDSDVDQTTGESDPFTLSFNYMDETHDAGLVSATTTTTKTGPQTATVGEQVTYTISVHNSGPTAASGVVVTDPLPQGTSYVASTGQGEYSNGTVTWDLGTMPTDGDATVTVTVTVNTDGTITNTSNTVADTPDPNPNDNSSSTTTNTSPQMFTLIVTRTGSGSGTVTSSPTGIDCGSTCSYTFTAGTVVTLTATPDAGSSFAGWSGAATGTSVATITMDGNKSVSATFIINTSIISNFIWKDINGDGIQNGSEPGFANVQVNLLDSTNTVLASTITDTNGLYAFTTVPNGIYKIAVIAPIGWGFTLKEQGGNPVIDSDVDQTTGISDPFSLSFNYLDEAHDAGLVSANTTTNKTGPPTATTGEQVTYTISVHNSGPTASSGVVVKDPLPQGTTYVVSTGNGEYTNGTVTWNLGTMQPNSDATVTVTVTTTASGDVTNTSTTVTDTPDPNPNDNSSSTTTTVSPQTFTLTVARAGSGSGTVTSSPTGIDCGATCSYAFSSGTVVTLTAIPDAGSSFTGWSGAATGTGNATITLDSDKLVVATFNENSNSTLQGILQDIISYRGTVDNKNDGKKLDEVIKNITKALNTSYWTDGDHLSSQRGEKVFDETKDAVNKLRNLMKEKKSTLSNEVLQDFIDRIIQVMRSLSVAAITDAVNLQGNANDLAKANEELAKGDEDVSNAKYESGIEHYRKAWSKAVKSLPQSARITETETMGVEGQIAAESIPTEFGLMQNYPNPFNPYTMISYNIASESKVTLKVFDMLGREIRMLVDSDLSPGTYEAEFNGSDLASGIYIYQIIAVPTLDNDKAFISAKKFILMK